MQVSIILHIAFSSQLNTFNYKSYKKKWNKLTWTTKKEFGSTTPFFSHIMDHIWSAFVDYG
jgi:hypothetical protein